MKDLTEALIELDRLMVKDPRTLNQFKSCSEDGLGELHYILGRWLRNTWGLWAGSELSDYFNSLGITHADDMSGIIIKSYWRKLHDLPINLATQVNFYREYWEREEYKGRIKI